MAGIDPYPDGRWTAADDGGEPPPVLWCRGNVGEVFPNVVTPLSASFYVPDLYRGQVRAVHRLGGISTRQLRRAEAEGRAGWMTAIFGGYIYGNVTVARAAAARAPGLSVDVVDRQMFGLHDGPPHDGSKGDLDPAAIGRTMSMMRGALQRPDESALGADQLQIAEFAAAQPAPTGATVDQLLATVEAARPWADRMMFNLLVRSARAALARSVLERLVAAQGGDDLVNRLTAGQGTIESAEPAHELWRLGRRVAGSPALTAHFDAGPDGLDQRLRADPAAAPFVAAFDRFRQHHGARGPDEWELCSPTWLTGPALGLAMVDRLRHAPADRDPVATAKRLAVEAAELAVTTRQRLTPPLRPLFDRALRGAGEHSAQREATKAAFVRALLPARLALAELAARSAFEHRDFFLLRLGEIPAALADPDAQGELMAERRRRRDHLQARVPPFWFERTLPHPDTWVTRDQRRQPESGPRTLNGMAICPGQATGAARVVTDPADPRGLEPGEILVAPLTDPAWTPLFLAAAGVVVDVGAQQSHAAIVARELGIPCVVSVPDASATIPDGARITVDGSAGTVTVH